MLINRDFLFPHPLARPTAPRRNRKVAGTKTDVF